MVTGQFGGFVDDEQVGVLFPVQLLIAAGQAEGGEIQVNPPILLVRTPGVAGLFATIETSYRVTRELAHSVARKLLPTCTELSWSPLPRSQQSWCRSSRRSSPVPFVGCASRTFDNCADLGHDGLAG